MAYSPIPSYDSGTGSEGSSTNDKEQHSLPLNVVSRWASKPHLNLYVAVTTTLLCVLLIADISILHHRQATCTSRGREIQTQFGRDSNYMSLDHRFDQYWSEDLAGGEGKVIELDDGNPMFNAEGENIGSPASISM
jgi:hypothetical protein